MRFPRPDQDRPRRAFGWPPGLEEVEVRDERECIRLDVVGLASEVATQASRIDETLSRADEPAGRGVADRARELAVRARALLEPHADEHEGTETVLLDALLAMRRDQRTMLRLRAEADELARGGRAERHTVWAALQASLAGMRR